MVFSKPEFIIERLATVHDLTSFDCGTSALTEWFHRFAWSNQQADAARVYVAHRRDNIVVGYYSLTASSVILLGRLAVDDRYKNQGIGKALLLDAILRTAQAADTVGVRTLVAHAIDDNAKKFYQHFNFEPSPVDPMNLMLLIKDLRALLRT